MRVFGALMLTLLGACTSTGVVPIDRDTYLIAKRTVPFGILPPAYAKADIYREANGFCAGQGMALGTVSFRATSSDFSDPAVVSLEFRCLLGGFKNWDLP